MRARMNSLAQILKQLAPMGAAVGYVALLIWSETRRRQRLGERPPTDRKMLRPPGHSLSEKVDDLWADALLGIVFALAMAAITGMELNLPLPPSSVVGAVIMSGTAMVIGLVSGTRKLLSVRTYSLGLKGERLVAQELVEAVAYGYRVFHDFPGSPKWNIDHIAVGPGGVYAIETKTRRKRKPIEGRSEFKVLLEGDCLHYGWCDDPDAVPQARRNAVSLGQFLTSAVGEPVRVTPVVAIPGWWVEMKTRSDVVALNSLSLPRYLRNQTRTLREEMVQRIAHQLDQKCRDVEI
jgi:hypothetical protein